MLFSLLLANYNNSRFIDTCLKSVYEQNYHNWEVIIVDDGCTDNFEEVIKKYEGESRIRVLRNGINKGCAYTKRKLIANAHGDLVAFLDPDDALHPDALRVMVEAHRRRPDCSLINSTHFVCDDQLNPLHVSTKPGPLPANTPYLMVSDGRIHHFATFKKRLYDLTVGVMPIRKYDKAVDQDLYYLLEEVGEVQYIDRPLYYYRIHKGSISNMGHEPEAMKSHLQIIEEACLRRITKLKMSADPDSASWIRKYRTRMYKVRIMNSFRTREWGRFVVNMMIFPFVGGMENIISYAAKFPREGMALLRKSFSESYQHQ